MTDRLKGLTVALTHDVRDDDAQCIIDAILMIKGVANVTTQIADSGDWINRQQIKHEITSKLHALAKEI